ncbi:MAG: hypothetical protein ABFE01_05515 [Phycisphaerales bacterium]
MTVDEVYERYDARLARLERAWQGQWDAACKLDKELRIRLDSLAAAHSSLVASVAEMADLVPPLRVQVDLIDDRLDQLAGEHAAALGIDGPEPVAAAVGDSPCNTDLLAPLRVTPALVRPE